MATLQASEEHAAWLARQPVAPPSEPGAVRLERVGDVLNVVLDRPTAHNAIDRFMRDQLFEAFELAALDADIKRVRLSGEGRSFSVGADLTEFGTTRDAAAGHLIRRRTLPASTLLQVAEKVEAHVNGACIGAGLEIAAFAKQVNASANSWFQLPELAMGIMPGAGGCVSLSRRIGRQRTALLALSGARIGARVALAWGLIDAIVDD
jgi:enoyl-CoA hydratase/carnithine racemase